MLDTCDAPVIDTGTVYGPAPTRNSVPGGETRICPPLAGGGTGTAWAAVGAPATVALCGGAVADGTVVVPGVAELPGGTTATPPAPGATGWPGAGCAGATAAAGSGVGASTAPAGAAMSGGGPPRPRLC